MIFIALLGFIAIIFSILYLIFHFLKRIKDKQRVLSKRVFYTAFLGGISLFILGVAISDTNTQVQLDDLKEQNESLFFENIALNFDRDQLIRTVVDFENKEEKWETKADEYEEKVTSLEKDKNSFKEEKSSLEEEIEELAEANTDLEGQVESLKSELSSANKKVASLEEKANTVSTTSSTSSNSSSSSSSSNTSASSSNVYFKNCTAAKDAGAAPVYRGDPGYGSHLDRDGDGVGCE